MVRVNFILLKICNSCLLLCLSQFPPLVISDWAFCRTTHSKLYLHLDCNAKQTDGLNHLCAKNGVQLFFAFHFDEPPLICKIAQSAQCFARFCLKNLPKSCPYCVTLQVILIKVHQKVSLHKNLIIEPIYIGICVMVTD